MILEKPLAGFSLEPSEERFFTRAALLAIFLLTASRLLWLLLSRTDLYPDEAQYWLWSRHFAFGYYSKPPLVAWLIALSTLLLGNSEFAVRFWAPFLHALAALFIYGIGSRLYDRRVGFWSALFYASLPGVCLSSLLISTDAVLLPSWAAALYAFIRAREEGGARWWVALGIAIGAGFLAKYAMVYFLLSAVAFVLFFGAERRHLRGLLGASAIAFLVFLPNLLWNAENGFASFGAVERNAALEGSLFHPLAFLAFFGSQFVVFGPLFFAFLLWFFVRPRALSDPRSRLLAAFILPALLIVLLESLLKRAHANWAAPAYVAASALLAALLIERGFRRVLSFSIAFHLVVFLLIFGGAEILPSFGLPLPARYDPLHRVEGWKRLGQRVGALLARHKGSRLLADDRETLAALSYYARPNAFDAVDWDPSRRIGNEWDLTSDLSRKRGGNFLVVSKHHSIAEMRPSFAKITPLGPLVIAVGPGLERRYSLYLAQDFIGYPPRRRREEPQPGREGTRR